ncbi:MAG: phosphoribosylformylglycinamidine cyclo-ligase [Candidatus Zixiibacteriota bacterium]|nr:MAG: phosphoribosylformylglycinamidine cyclo-ligase [candidate division Zixibacteria bacterium]
MKEAERYREAGVDLESADRAKSRLGELVRRTFTKEIAGDFGDFGSAFSLKGYGGKEKYLVSSVDGAGTKLKIAFMSGRHDTVGRDLVNHLVNDILCLGARPLFFMDYIGLGKMNEDIVFDIVKGMTEGCKENGCALLGGETAEMPGFYADGEYDIAGFIAGMADKDAIPGKSALKAGDLIIGFSSNGLHTNGYTLARKAFFDIGKMKLDDLIPETGTRLGEELLKIHFSYFNTIYPLMKKRLIKAAAHITGGGFEGNISRILSSKVDAVINTYHWFPPGIFKAIMRLANVGVEEMYRVFNMGIGFVTVVGESEIPKLRKYLDAANCEVVPIGMLRKGTGKVILQYE